MPKVVWTSENDRKLLIRLIERSAKSYDTVELCKIFPGATPKAIEERIAKLKREAKAMDHPKPRNHPKGKSGPKKRVALEVPLALAEDAGSKKIKVVTDESSVSDFSTESSEVSCPTKIEDEVKSTSVSSSVKCELETESEPHFEPEDKPETGHEIEPGTEPDTEPENGLEVELKAEPDKDTESEPEFESEFERETEEIEDQKPCLIKPEPDILEGLCCA